VHQDSHSFEVAWPDVFLWSIPPKMVKQRKLEVTREDKAEINRQKIHTSSPSHCFTIRDKSLLPELLSASSMTFRVLANRPASLSPCSLPPSLGTHSTTSYI